MTFPAVINWADQSHNQGDSNYCGIFSLAGALGVSLGRDDVDPLFFADCWRGMGHNFDTGGPDGLGLKRILETYGWLYKGEAVGPGYAPVDFVRAATREATMQRPFANDRYQQVEVFKTQLCMKRAVMMLINRHDGFGAGTDHDKPWTEHDWNTDGFILGGSHWVFGVGYDLGVSRFKVENHGGPTQHDKGYFGLPIRLVEQGGVIQDFWVIDYIKGQAPYKHPGYTPMILTDIPSYRAREWGTRLFGKASATEPSALKLKLASILGGGSAQEQQALLDYVRERQISSSVIECAMEQEQGVWWRSIQAATPHLNWDGVLFDA